MMLLEEVQLDRARMVAPAQAVAPPLRDVHIMAPTSPTTPSDLLSWERLKISISWPKAVDGQRALQLANAQTG